MAKWIKFSINFATIEGDDEEALLDQITDACVAIVDPACYALDDNNQPKEGHKCTRDWTAGATTMSDIAEEDLSDEEYDQIFDTVESAACSFCARPLPDSSHEIPRLVVSLAPKK